MSEKWYVLYCRQCDEDSYPMAIPFASARERGQWATEHTKGTGHNRWIVVDEPKP